MSIFDELTILFGKEFHTRIEQLFSWLKEIKFSYLQLSCLINAFALSNRIFKDLIGNNK